MTTVPTPVFVVRTEAEATAARACFPGTVVQVCPELPPSTVLFDWSEAEPLKLDDLNLMREVLGMSRKRKGAVYPPHVLKALALARWVLLSFDYRAGQRPVYHAVQTRDGRFGEVLAHCGRRSPALVRPGKREDYLKTYACSHCVLAIAGDAERKRT